MLLVFRANSLRYNRGGLLLSSNSSSSVARMSAVLKSNAIAFNSNSSSLALFGNGVQRVIALNNLITHNYALYADTIRASGVLANMSHNLVSANVGWHTVDTQSTVDAQMHFLDNFFEANLALGHGNQYAEKYGFHDGNERDEFLTRRPKRQVLAQRGVSFDWWTHVEPAETGRYRSTILACSPHQHFARNVFNNPLNDFELTTGPLRDTQLQFDAAAAVDARLNYWGPPGTVGVAAGKIRDQRDDKRLVRVDFQPLLESNTSLIEGDCPPGWFQVGQEEFKSCFLFVGASSTYADAVQFCQRLGAFMPILRNADARRNELARRIDALGQRYVTDVERQNSFGGIVYDVPIWVSAVSIPSNQCGWMSSRTASIGEHNCHNLLPFVCERGTKPYQEPLLWRREVVLIAVLLVLLLMCVALLGCCAWRKRQRKRQEEFPRTKQHLRDSLRNSKQQKIGRSATDFVPLEAFGPTLKGPVDERTFTSLTDYGDRQQHFSSMSTSAASCGKTRTEKKLSDESCSSFSGSQCACASNSRWGHATNCHTCAMYSTVPADESIRSSAESSASSSCCTSSSLTPPSSSGDVSSDSTLTLTAQRPLLNYKRRRPPAPPPPAEASRAQQNQHYHFEFATPSLTGTLSNPNIAYRPRPRPDLHQQAQQRHSGFFPAPPPLSARDRDVPKNRNLSAASQELGASEETLRHQEPVEPRHHWANAPPPAVSLRPRQPPPIAPRRQQQPRIRVSMEAITPLETSM